MTQEHVYSPLNEDSDAPEKESSESIWQKIVPDKTIVHKWPLAFALFNLILILLWTLIHFDVFSVEKQNDSQLAILENGIYSGRYDTALDQFHFLGMPYALPPLGHLRFRIPQPFDQSWEGVRSATEFGPMCTGYRVSVKVRYDFIGDY